MRDAKQRFIEKREVFKNKQVMSAINNDNETNGNRYNSQFYQFQVKFFIANSNSR
jgi:hypothetical protein